MPQNRYYYYDHEACAFVEVRPKRTQRYVQGAVVLVLAFVMTGVLTWGLDGLTVSPQELALKAENEALQQQLARVGQRMQAFASQIDHLAQADQQLYSTLFETEPLPADVRRVGVGGSDPYERFNKFSAGTSSLLRRTSQTLDELERQISLQNGRYRELAKLARERDRQLDQTPYLLPADGPVVSGYGVRRHPILRVHKKHEGIDVLVRQGSSVVAAADGVVKTAEFSPSYGYYVQIDHPASGYTTLYAHLSQIPAGIKPGKAVQRGDQIGLSGSTGRSTAPHLHYEVHDASGEPVNPIFFFAPNMTPHEYKKLLQEAEQSVVALD